ncbi:hypothetical protein [Leuconostoc mesenteroides]|uniref:hypothetical protein n=1 Tax=Leuconostoc mesenteroides TaxID=1245 RepID=UPI0032E04F0B
MAYQPTDWEHGDIITGGKLNKIEKELTHVADNATYGFGGAQLSSDGLTPFSYINAGDPMPANPQKGDTVFLKDGNDFLIYSYNGEDWVLKIDPDLSNRIEETIKTASDNTDKAIADNNTQINETINQVAKEQADLAVKDGDFNNKAQAMADKALQDAKNNTATVAKSTLDTANQNIADAKKSVTDDIAQEASDRASAVGALDTKAQGYADTAKKNAIDVATSADGVINKKIDDTASSITSTVSQNKMDAEGKITTAQSTATQALNGLSSKVDTSTYNAKTGQLTTDVTNVTQTANQAKTDIASIKQTDTTQDARMTTIEADADGTKTTVSNLQKAQNTQSGSISTLQQRADGFDATVTKVDSLAVGGRNYFLNSSGTSLDGWSQTSGWAVVSGTNRGTVFTIKPTATWGGGNYNAIYQNGINIPSGTQVTVSFWAKASVNGAKFHSEPNGSYSTYNPTLSTAWTRYSYTFTLTTTTIYFMGVDAGTIYYLDDVKIETGNVATDWTPAPEDVDSATAKAQLTADQATTALNNYKINADGHITKAQSDITQTAKDVTTKVSQTDYNAKTGDLDTRVTKAQLTADGAVTTVGAYKTSNDNRVKATETSIAQNTKDITLRATSTDLDSAKKDYNAQIAQVKVNADSVTNQVSSIQAKINSMGQVNQLANTEFNPDYSSWYDRGSHGKAIKASLGTPRNGSNVIAKVDGSPTRLQSEPIAVTPGMKVSYSVNKLTSTGLWSYLNASDADGNIINIPGGTKNEISATALAGTTFLKVENITIPDGVYYISLGFLVNGTVANGDLFQQPMLVFGSTVGDYVPGAYNSNDKVAVQQITIDGITDTVSKQGTNIDSVTKRVTTAEGTLSTATNNISGLQSSVTQTANQIKTEITDRTKGDANTLQSSKDFTQSSITSAVNGVNSTITQTSNAILAKVGATNLFPNSEFDADYGYRGKGSKTVLSLATKSNIDGAYNGTVSVTSTGASYEGYWANNIQVQGGQKYSASVLVHYTNGGLSSGQALLDIWFYDKDNKRISGASRSTGQVSSPYWVKISNEGFTAPTNAVYLQMSLIVNNAGPGQVATFTQPLLTATEKLQEYTPNDDMSAQLSLFKDNWSIGITDNISKITSGIVGNASQMSLISKNVTIDSPNTQIKGTAWIQSAMIANGAIGSAQIGDATITSAKIATLDVAKLTGNVSNFIQSNWNGLYQSVKISPIGMTISTSQGSTAQFNQDGLVLEGALGTTNVLNGQIELISSKNEYLGTFQHETMPDHDNVDYLMIKLAGWHTGKSTDPDYDLNSDGTNTIRGGDGIGFGVTNSVGTYDMKMSWDSSLVAGYKGRKAGWHVEDIMTWHQPTYFEGGFDVAQQFSSTDRRALHIQGATLSNGHKWFGFFDTPSKAGFGTDDTNDVLFYMKGKSYSLYTMLSKLNML